MKNMVLHNSFTGKAVAADKAEMGKDRIRKGRRNNSRETRNDIITLTNGAAGEIKEK